MTAETLRRAAALMRERAAAAAPGPWRWEEPSGDKWPQGDESLVVEATGDPVLWGWGYDASGIDGEDADRAHIASWHPAVALAVANLLDGLASDTPWDFRHDEALAVARNYLGEIESFRPERGAE